MRGLESLQQVFDDGSAAGEGASALALPAGKGPSRPELAGLRVNSEYAAKKIVCLCEDVTENDLTHAVAEGYDELEMLKRFSTVSMGPCQGKTCSVTASALCARASGLPVDEAAMTTLRPP